MGQYQGYVTLLNINDSAFEQNIKLYQIGTNQEEVLKYFDQEGKWNFSLANLVISVYKSDASESQGRRKIFLESVNDLSLSISSGSGWIELNVPEEYKSEDFLTLVDGEVEIAFANIPAILNILEDGTSFKNILQTILKQEAVLKISYLVTESNGDSFLAEKTVNIRNAMTEELAKLSVQANGIYASIASTALDFNSKGLTIRNGGLSVVKVSYIEKKVTEEEFNNQILYEYNGEDYILAQSYSSDGIYFEKKEISVLTSDTDGDLTITGTVYATNGKFSGELEGASGSFSGSVIAESGKIGKFSLEDGILSAPSQDNMRSPLVLDSNTGAVYAKNIELGSGAKIENFLSLGESVKILNPDLENNNGSYLQVFDGESKIIDFNKEGLIRLGKNDSQIEINSKTQEITGLKNSAISWQLSPNNSIFNNATFYGSIKAATFEQGTVQAIGGAMLMRPSSKIIGYEYIQNQEVKIFLEEIPKGFEIEDICLLKFKNTGNGFTQSELFIKIEEINLDEKSLTFRGTETQYINEENIGMPIINLGKAGSISIGLNGSDSEVYGIESGSISVMEFDGVNINSPKVIIGKIPNNSAIYGQASGSYGLYAENVVLNGSLTTRTLKADTTDRCYSGIGTTLGIKNAPSTIGMQDKFPEAHIRNNLGQILIWAGAATDSKEDIEKSKFFVDEYGNMYAGSGYFDGTIITNSTIEAAEIKTAVLTGTGSGPALKIKDVEKGIHFSKGEETVFEVNNNSFIVNSSVLFNENFKVDNFGNLSLQNITLTKTDGNLVSSGIMLDYSGIGIDNAAIEFDAKTNSIIFNHGKNISNLSSNSSGLRFNGNLVYGTKEGQNYMEYRQFKQVVGEKEQIIGYDLYVY